MSVIRKSHINNTKMFLIVFTAIIMVGSAFAAISQTGNGNYVGDINANVNTLHPGLNSMDVNNHPIPVNNTILKGYKYIHQTPTNKNILFTVDVPLNNVSLLNSYANEVNTPGSPLYHKFMTNKEIKNMFLPVNRYNHEITILKSKGFHVDSSSSDPIIVASQSAGYISNELGLNISCYSNGISSYYYGYGTPSLNNVNVLVTNITGLYLSHPSTLVTQKEFQHTYKSENQTAPLEGYSPKYLEQVYNATSLYKEGYNGSGKTIGILDFGGDPYIKEQLSYFDHEFNISNSPNFTIVPVGPYQPLFGVTSGWAGEISLDVESSHTMAPGANITLYIGNLNCALAPLIATIDSQDKVNTLSQSFSIPESDLSSTASGYEACIQTTNELYAMGSLEGITFSASSGDVGASGFSTGPLGTVGYPATSPYVTAVGGTSTYLDINGTQVVSFNQTAWSNYGFVPQEVNYGGSTGGISYIQPKPFYQDSLKTPKSYPNGRMVPDLSFEATLYPGFFYVMPGNVTGLSGGTSEASPLFSGLMALMDDADHTKAGMINPDIYYMGEHNYSKVFNPVTFGYNIPFTDHYGYNLVNGWGSLNIGAFANEYKMLNYNVKPKLNIIIKTTNENLTDIALGMNNATALQEYTPGMTVYVWAEIQENVTGKLSNVTTGHYNASLITLNGTVLSTKLSYNSSLSKLASKSVWESSFVMPSNATGPSYIDVSGYNGTTYGNNVDNIFSGYYVHIFNPSATEPISTECGIPVSGELEWLNGTVVNNTQFHLKPYNVTMSLYTYSIMSNEYTNDLNLTLVDTNGTLSGLILGNYPDTVALLKGINAYAYIPFMNGAYLQGTEIFGPVIGEPGTVGAGQNILIHGTVMPPTNELTGLGSYCSNITFSLINPNNQVVSKITTKPVDLELITGVAVADQLPVPSNATTGLYTILINTTYKSVNYNDYINGSFYGQIYVSSQYNIPKISVNSSLYEGETTHIMANIQFKNGTEVKYGMYSATLYPKILSSEYSIETELTQIPLYYNSTINRWEGTMVLPSPYNSGSYGKDYYGLSLTAAELPVGQYYIYVSGISSNGVPTTTNSNAQKEITIEPYDYITNTIENSLVQNYGLALNNVTMDHFTGNLTGSVLLAMNTVNNSNLNIYYSSINGTLYVNNSNIHLFDVYGLNIVATNSTITMVSSSLNTLNLNMSRIINENSTVNKITPGQAHINIISPVQNDSYNGTVNIKLNVVGNDISNVELFIAGKDVYNTTNTGLIHYSFNTTGLKDGSYPVTVQVMQKDGIISQNSTTLTTDNQISTLGHTVSKLSKSNGIVYDIAYGGVAAGSIGIGLAGYLLAIRRLKK
ncbi:MAG: hypothetical protein AMDU4_FER2C00247G0005 [Ferroplasma sp. Type II]|uniref:protease pro-enzyme activation domain-containing protein n=1 Tax=Ferroplasma sp. Type II TaxID=261388 RepID=UPI00038960F1|nr:protease pro-enzyme activation domain-containing protein [Ferroplasma sp. Type II]EQB70290.1 MAG: hypothetical protein AMDU4_FER2C00247G0005 [Ferroplasma sp. Type II]